MAGHLTLPRPAGDLDAERMLFHDLVLAEGGFLLTALREVLTVFVVAGHPPAIDLSRKLGNAFR